MGCVHNIMGHPSQSYAPVSEMVTLTQQLPPQRSSPTSSTSCTPPDAASHPLLQLALAHHRSLPPPFRGRLSQACLDP